MYSLLGRKFILIFFFMTIQICLNGEEIYWERKVENQVSVYGQKLMEKLLFGELEKCGVILKVWFL